MKLSPKLVSRGDTLEILSDILDSVGSSIYIKDLNGTFLGCNQVQLEFAELASYEEFIGKNDDDMPWKAQAEEVRNFDREVIRLNKTIYREEVAKLPNREPKYFLSRKSPLWLNNELVGIVGISIDITKEKELEVMRKQKDKIKQQNMQLRQQISALHRQATTLAHELKTPLGGIKLGSNAIKLLTKNIEDPKTAKMINDIIKDINGETDKTTAFINIILGNVRDLKQIPLSHESIKECVSEAISRYPYEDQNEQHLIKTKKLEDFIFNGNKELMIHILFNLIKNALYFIAKAEKGEIAIWSEIGTKSNQLHFKDTAQGMDKIKLTHIFDEFYTDTGIGTGIGLYFCKRAMQEFGGDITCRSKKGEYTHFILSFPVVSN